MRRLVKDYRPLFVFYAVEHGATVGFCRGQKSLKDKFRRKKPRYAKSGNRGARSLNNGDPYASFRAQFYYILSRVAYRGHSRVGYKSTGFAVFYARNDHIPTLALVVFKITHHRLFYTVVGKKNAARTRVLGGDKIHLRKHLLRSFRYVGKVSYRRSHKI